MSNAVVSDWPSGVANTGWPQEPSAMLMPGRVQGWPAGTQRAANAAERLLSQAVAWWDVEQYREGDRFLRNRGTGGELLDLRLGSSIVANSNDPRFLAPEDSGYVWLPGVAGNYFSVPDAANLDLTSDLDLRVRVALDDWTPASIGNLISKWGQDANQRSYYFNVLQNGVLRFGWSPDGTNSTLADSTVAPTVSNGDPLWVRVTLDADNGASGHDVKFYTSSDGASWTQLGTTVTTAGTAALYSGSAVVEFGSVNTGQNNAFAGKFYRAQVLNGIDGTTVLDIDCDAITSGSATSFTAGTGQTVTINRSASGRKSVAVPSRHKGGKPVMLLGTDDYLEVQDSWQHALLNFDAGQSFTVVVVARDWGTTATRILFAKRTASTSGYMIYRFNNSEYGLTISDGSASPTVFRTGTFTGTLDVIAAVRNTATDALSVSVAGTPGTPVADTTTGSLAGSDVLRIGRFSGAGTNYSDMEFYAAAVFRRALSAAEVKLISDEMTRRIA